MSDEGDEERDVLSPMEVNPRPKREKTYSELSGLRDETPMGSLMRRRRVSVIAFLTNFLIRWI